MSILKEGWVPCFICVRFNLSLEYWVRFHTWTKNFKLFGASFEFCQWGDSKENGWRQNLPLDLTSLTWMEGGRIYHWIDFSNMHKVIAKQTKWSNNTGELAYWKLHSMDQDILPWRTWLSSALQYTLSRENLYFDQGQYIYRRIITDQVLCIGYVSI